MTKNPIRKAHQPIEEVTDTLPCRIAYFGFDAGHENIRRRMKAFMSVGAELTGYMMRRGELPSTDWRNIDLGLTKDRAFIHRLYCVARALPIVYANRKIIANVELIWARNLEMLLLAWLAKVITRSKARLVYEVLDIHSILYTNNLKGKIARVIERFLMRKTSALVVSSPGFLRDYFTPVQRYTGTAVVWENRMLLNETADQRPIKDAAAPRALSPVKLGYVGGLRCAESLEILLQTAQTLNKKVEIHLHGYFSALIPDGLRQRILKANNVHWHGEYKHPDDIAGIYNQLDLIWAGDLSDGLNSNALLPNRIYEGSYFGVVPIAPAASEVGRWVNKTGVGFTIDEPLQKNLSQFLVDLTPQSLTTKKGLLLQADQSLFLESNATPIRVLQTILQDEQSVGELGAVT